MNSSLYGQSKVLPSSVRLGLDLSRLTKKVLDPDRSQYEINADVDVYKFFITADYGQNAVEVIKNIKVIKSLDFKKNTLNGAIKIW